MRIPSTPFLMIVVAAGGCMPEPGPPIAQSPIKSSVAAQLQSKIRSKHGAIYTVDHDVQGTTLQASWELGNALKRTSQLQIKPPIAWSPAQVVDALEVVLGSHSTKPWYGQIDETIIRNVRELLDDDEREFAKEVAAETPYQVSLTVKRYSREWFVQAKVIILDEDGINVGF